MRTCPSCSHQFSRSKTVEPKSKFHYCPYCMQIIYYDKKKTLTQAQGERIESDKKATIKIIQAFEEGASRFRGAPFYFEGAGMNKEKAMVKHFIAKCRNYVNRSKLQGKIDGAEFALRMVEFVFSDSRHAWLAGVASSVSAFMGKKFADLASGLFNILRKENEAEEVQAFTSPTVDLSSVNYAII